MSLMDQRQPSHLAHQIAGIAADLSSNGPAWGPQAALRALIQTWLLRIFTRLEALLTLWQAGQLPQPATTQRHNPAPPPSRAATAPRTASPRTRRRRPPPLRIRTRARARTRPHSVRHITPATRPPVAPAPRPPPHRCRKSPPKTAHSRAYNVTISK